MCASGAVIVSTVAVSLFFAVRIITMSTAVRVTMSTAVVWIDWLLEGDFR
jgi:hypothetical protein